MRTHLIMAVAILAASGIAAFVANASWYRMEWIRKEIKNPTPPVTQPSDSDEGGVVEDTRPSPGNHDFEEGYIRIDDVLEHLANKTAIFVDAREQNDWDESHLRCAIFVPAEHIFDHANNLMAGGADVSDLVIVYCGSPTCDASHIVADSLRRDFSFENVLIYKNGWEEIEASGRFNDYVVVGEEL